MSVEELIAQEPRTRPCRRCAVEINAASARCPFCGARQFKRQPILGWWGALVCLILVAAAVVVTRQIVIATPAPLLRVLPRRGPRRARPGRLSGPQPHRPSRHRARRAGRTPTSPRTPRPCRRRCRPRHAAAPGCSRWPRSCATRRGSRSATAARSTSLPGRARRPGARVHDAPRPDRRVRLRRLLAHDRGDGDDLRHQPGRRSTASRRVLPAGGERDLRRPGVQQPGPRRRRDPAGAAEADQAPAKRSSASLKRNGALDHREVPGVLEDLELGARGAAGRANASPRRGTSMSSRPCTISVGASSAASSPRMSCAIIALSAVAQPRRAAAADQLDEHRRCRSASGGARASRTRDGGRAGARSARASRPALPSGVRASAPSERRSPAAGLKSPIDIAAAETRTSRSHARGKAQRHLGGDRTRPSSCRRRSRGRARAGRRARSTVCA